MSLLPENIATLDPELHRKFGLNLLLLQQCERLIKSLVAHQDVAGAVDELHNVKARQIESHSKKTLGQVVGDLTGNCFATALDWSDSEQYDEPPCDITQPWMRIRSKKVFAQDDFKRVQQKLADFVDLRNELVHHFLEKYDLSTEFGCLAADAYLDACFKQIEAQYKELQQWSDSAAVAKGLMANLMNTSAFSDFFIHGNSLDGLDVDWSHCTIVELLRDAEVALAKDGWTSLQNAIGLIGKREPEHTPKKYGCRSWRHILHESEQFEIRKEQTNPGLPTVTWYRSRP